jgi:nucleoside-diphosphate-sugar epimerase
MAISAIKTLSTPRVLLTGASGQIGVFAIPRLLAAGFRIVAVSRTGRPEHQAAHDAVQWMHPEEALVNCLECQYLLSAGPLDLSLKFLGEGRQFRSAVVFSSSSVVSKRESSDPDEKQLIGEMLAKESSLQTLADSNKLKLVVFRPTLIYGCGLDNNISRLANLIRRFGFMPINGKGSGLRQPVHADDLATVAVKALLHEAELPRSLVLAGGNTLSYAEMVNSIFIALQKPARLARIPEWILVPLVSALAKTGFASGLNSAMVKRQLIDLVFDDSEARQLLNYNPRPFAPTGDDFNLPFYT